ncbi:MAG: exosortase A [Gammaproteobacteria bacterium]|nr:exosortase A [Gammaproteobacteria bacterium]
MSDHQSFGSEITWANRFPIYLFSFLILLWLYQETLGSMVTTWWNIGTYSHGLIIFPVSLWLIWQSKQSLIHIHPQPTLLVIIPLILVTLTWIAAYQVGLVGIQQFAFITLIQLLCISLVGTTVFKHLIFPMLFLYLSVPFGDFLIRPLMEFTADMTVFLLKVTGIPVYRNGLFFMLPTGQWSVVEACSGIRYLIASLTIAVLFSYFCYTSYLKRFVFIVAGLVIPVIANSIRAYVIVLIGHFSNMTLATGIDHLIYGWLFFGVIIAVLMWIGLKFQDPLPVVRIPSKTHDNHGSTLSDQGKQSDFIGHHKHLLAVAGSMLLVCSIGPLSAFYLKQQQHPQLDLGKIKLPESQSPWLVVHEPVPWEPHFIGQSLQLSSLYQNQSEQVQLTMIVYPNESQGHELINGQNSLFPVKDSDWHLMTESKHHAPSLPDIPIRESLIAEQTMRLIWQLNWVNGQFMIDDINIKLSALSNRLLMKRHPSIAIFISSETTEDTTVARQRLDEFLRTMSPSLFTIINQFDKLFNQPSSYASNN